MTLDEIVESMTEIDRECFSRGYDHGNYAAAYNTEDYSEALRDINGTNGFYRAGHLLGFFSSYELHEIYGEINGAGLREEVRIHRDAFDQFKR